MAILQSARENVVLILLVSKFSALCALPNTKVVKALNTVTGRTMVYPQEVAGGDHNVFVSANDMDAKMQVVDLLRAFGWTNIFDLGDLSTARGTEAYMLLWVRLFGAMNTGMINIKIMK